jgi:hypothetical protein
MYSGLLLTAATAAALTIAAGSANAAWDFVDVKDPGAGPMGTIASGINDSGQVVGTFFDNSNTRNGFSLSGASYSTVDVPGAAATAATGVNNSGQITGYYTDGSGGVHGFTQTGGSATPFDEPSGVGATRGADINGSGTVVGSYFDTGGAEHGFSKTGASYTSFDVTGLGTALNTQASGINAAGTIVGSFSNGTITHGFVDTGGAFAAISDPLGVNGTWATGIDNHGDIVGYYVDGGGITHGFVDLGGTYQTVDDPNAGPGGGTEILGVNNALMVVGYYVDPNGVFVGFTAEVPEPATIALFGLSALGMAALRRRRIVSAA